VLDHGSVHTGPLGLQGLKVSTGQAGELQVGVGQDLGHEGGEQDGGVGGDKLATDLHKAAGEGVAEEEGACEGQGLGWDAAWDVRSVVHQER